MSDKATVDAAPPVDRPLLFLALYSSLSPPPSSLPPLLCLPVFRAVIHTLGRPCSQTLPSRGLLLHCRRLGRSPVPCLHGLDLRRCHHPRPFDGYRWPCSSPIPHFAASCTNQRPNWSRFPFFFTGASGCCALTSMLLECSCFFVNAFSSRQIFVITEVYGFVVFVSVLGG